MTIGVVKIYIVCVLNMERGFVKHVRFGTGVNNILETQNPHLLYNFCDQLGLIPIFVRNLVYQLCRLLQKCMLIFKVVFCICYKVKK